MLNITPTITLADDEIELRAIHSQGAGGQNVNKVATAIHLRFDIENSSLPVAIKKRLRENKDRRINKDGILVIKAQRYRSQEKNRDDALERLAALIRTATAVRKNRVPTRPSKRVRAKRVDSKVHQGRIKQLRGKPDIDNGD